VNIPDDYRGCFMSTNLTLVAVTGATGFVGKAVARALAHREEYSLRVVVRGAFTPDDNSTEVVRIESIDAETAWPSMVQDAQVIIHAAARVHVMNDTSQDPEAEYLRINVAGTLNLAEQAAAAGVKRFIF